GGVHLVTMARTGVGRFHLADFDTFETANVNRQYGARVSDLGKPKLDVMIDQAIKINPYLKIKPFPDGVNEANIDAFLDGVDVVLDGLDFFQFDIRRQLFNRAREKGVYVITAGPMGFSSAMLIFSPHDGMSFDEYFNIVEGMSPEDQYLAFALGLAPRATHIRYMDLAKVDFGSKAGPSLNIACQICAGMAATEAVRILLDRGKVKPVPYFFQFDPYSQKYHKGKLQLGNRNPIQKVKMRAAGFLLERNKPSFRRPAADVPRIAPGDQAVTKDKIRYLIEAGIQAPSGDNAQPWKFACHGDTIDLYLDKDADHSFFNVQQIASIISSGAVLENMWIAAGDLGLGAHIDYLPAGETADHMATLALRSDEPSVQKDPLSESLWQRNTNRTFYRHQSIPATVIDAIKASPSGFPKASLHIVTKKPDLRNLAKIVYQVDRIRTEYRPLHEHLCHMIRFTDAEAQEKKDGLPIKNLEAGLAGEIFLKATRPWPVMNMANKLGVGRMVALHAVGGMLSAPGAALLTVEGMRPRDFLVGGQALERIWLTISKTGLCMQPMTAVTLFRMRWVLEGKAGFSKPHRELLEAVWENYQELFPGVDMNKHGQVMLFRFGYGRAIKHGTHRKKMESFLNEG
ncbi:ThiF family adenylyltransferase, partial [Desulfosarcina sp.]|uniref:ThiF family adenylyltransferase n=1 Tax=Desulfosarcina sp. TaxID=2027861 RepID=UPI0035685A26